MTIRKTTPPSILFFPLIVICTVAGPVHADVESDLGRGPVTVHVPPQ